MTITLATALLLSLALAQLWLVIAVRRAVPTTRSLAEAPAPTRWPLLSIIVPARDEAANIEAALASKLSCGYPALEVVVVDDRSTDQTPAILARLAERTPALRVTRVDELPDGWLGKLHAMHRGLAAARGEWVLFADADVHVERGTIERIIAHAEQQQLDFVAVFPKMLPVGPLVDASLAGLLRILVLAGRLWRINTDGSNIGGGVGAFNLARRKWIEDTAALEHLRMEIADDVALGVWLKQRGARTRFYAGQSTVSLVFQDSIRALLRSADKGGGMFGWVLWRPALVAAAPIAIELALPAVAIAQGGVAQQLALAALATLTAVHVLTSAHFGGPLRGAWLWPLAHLFNGATMLRAGWLAWRRQGVIWRGTFYPRAVVDAGRRLDPTTMRVAP